MTKKHTAQSGLFSLRPLLALLFCAAATCSMIVTGTLLAFWRSDSAAQASQRTLTFAERVSYQRAIEGVYWRHRIWPKERPDPKPSLDQAMPPAQLEKKWKTNCAILRRWRITGNSRLELSNCRPRWSAWQGTRDD